MRPTPGEMIMMSGTCGLSLALSSQEKNKNVIAVIAKIYFFKIFFNMMTINNNRLIITNGLEYFIEEGVKFILRNELETYATDLIG
jgi:hypothetical protein